MHILGISCGSPDGNSEILLKAALLAASPSTSTITTSLVSLQSLSLPTHPMLKQASPSLPPDDRPALLDAILDSDALIISAPIYTRQPHGLLKSFTDTAMGPMVDAAFVSWMIKNKAAGVPGFKDFVPDERVLKPRVVGLIAVGGAASSEWGTLALPGLHQSVFSLHAKVVDQVILHGHPVPGSVLVEGAGAVELAERVGLNVASQIGKPYDEASYLGKEGTCPYCHLDLVVLQKDNRIECGVCGAKGQLGVDEGKIKALFEKSSKTSVVTWKGKEAHMAEIGEVSKEIGPKMGATVGRKEEFSKMKFRQVDFPSQAKSSL